MTTPAPPTAPRLLTAVDVELNHGDTRWTTKVMGEDRGTPGLLITPELAAEEDGTVFYTGSWTVLHVKSGLSLRAFDTTEGAGYYLRELASVPDADFTADLPADASLWSAEQTAALRFAQIQAEAADEAELARLAADA